MGSLFCDCNISNAGPALLPFGGGYDSSSTWLLFIELFFIHIGDDLRPVPYDGRVTVASLDVFVSEVVFLQDIEEGLVAAKSQRTQHIIIPQFFAYLLDEDFLIAAVEIYQRV